MYNAINKNLNFTKFYDLQVFDIGFVYGKAKHGFYLMEPVIPSGPGVHVQHVVLLVIDHFQDVWVPAYKELWPSHLQRTPYAERIFSGPCASDMRHPHIHALAGKALVLRELLAQVHAINVAEYGHCGFKSL